MAYIALYRAWRPQRFEEVVGQTHISRTLKNALQAGRMAHAYLFCGPRGTGKTSMAKIMAKAANCLEESGEPCNTCNNCRVINEGSSMDVIEIDAASNRGIDEIRDLRERVKFAPSQGQYRVYIIDEVHMLTTEAFNALLKTLEEPPGHVLFIMATTEPHKIPATILSRCQRFDFRRLSPAEILGRLREIGQNAGWVIEEPALNLIVRKAEGGMRDALSILDQCVAYAGETVTAADVIMVTGTIANETLLALAGGLAQADLTGALQIVNEAYQEGKDIRQFTRDVVEHFRNLLLVATCPHPGLLLNAVDSTIAELQRQAGQFSRERLLDLTRLFAETEGDLKWFNQPRLNLELAIVKAINIKNHSVARVESELAIPAVETVSRVKTLPASGNQPETNRPVKNREVNQEVTPAVGDLKLITQNWGLVLEKLKKAKVSAHAILVEGEPAAIDGNILTITFKYPFHRDTISQPENRNLVEKAMKEVLKREVKVKFITKDQQLQPGAGENPEDPLVREAVRLFGSDKVVIKK